MGAEQQVLLEVRNLELGFDTGNGFQSAVKNISFTLNTGETLGIVGESGSGKSLTSLSVMRLLPAQARILSGEVRFTAKDGNTVDLLKLSAREMEHYRGNEIGMIFQEPMTSLNPVQRCGQQVMEALLTHCAMSRKEAYEKTLTLFEEVQLPDPKKLFLRYPYQLSGGQKQRVMIAMAMCCEPRILIADEPTTALDVTVQKTILELMKKLQQKYRMGILFITHDLGLISELAHKVMVMYKGQILEQGEVKKRFSNPEHAYTKGLLACKPPLDSRPIRLPVVNDFVMELSATSHDSQVQKNRNNTDTNTERKHRHEALYRGQKVLEVKDLKTWYPSKRSVFGKVLEYTRALDGVSFDVYQGETLGLVGESGCGKTTLGRSILKLAASTEGSIHYKGREIRQMSEGEFKPYRRLMQIIFQDPYSSLNPRIPIGKAILEPMQVHDLHGNDAQRIEKVMELLQKVGLEANQYMRYPHEFSGGQRQRICIARALAMQPEFLICDESVSALDVSVQAQVLNLLNALKEEYGFTVIFISHDLSVVKYMSDRMIVMQKGKIEEMGDPDEVYANPVSDYTRKLIGAIPKLMVN
ncbi:MAG TPA: ABC transporter ATP-binding protein [Bacteroidia bacterium]|nr:ABC transporter ATP-binding protein [Bacteroidia bacterium]